MKFSIGCHGRGQPGQQESASYDVERCEYYLSTVTWIRPTVWYAGRWENLPSYEEPRFLSANYPPAFLKAYRRARNLILRGTYPEGTGFHWHEESPRTLFVDLREDSTTYWPYGQKVKV